MGEDWGGREEGEGEREGGGREEGEGERKGGGRAAAAAEDSAMVVSISGGSASSTGSKKRAETTLVFRYLKDQIRIQDDQLLCGHLKRTFLFNCALNIFEPGC